jgi:hypothetical protein
MKLVVSGLLCGCLNPNQIAAWGRAQSKEFLRALGFKRGQAPGKSALYELLALIQVTELEERLAAWAESVLQEMASYAPDHDFAGEAEVAVTGTTGAPEGVALDGKTLRGSKKQGAEFSHLLSAVSHGLGLTLGQVGVERKTNEITAVPELLTLLVVEGRVFTMDALLTQRTIAEHILDEGGDYLMAVKGNQPTLHDLVRAAFADFSPSVPGHHHDTGTQSRPT